MSAVHLYYDFHAMICIAGCSAVISAHFHSPLCSDSESAFCRKMEGKIQSSVGETNSSLNSGGELFCHVCS